jgi:hypothetical protein
MKKLFLPAFLISFTTVLQIIIKAENLGTANNLNSLNFVEILISLTLFLVIIYFLKKRYFKDVMDFKKIFSQGLLMHVLSAMVVTIFLVIYINFINPNFIEALRQIQFIKLKEQSLKTGIDMEPAMKMAGLFLTSTGVIIVTFFTRIFGGCIFSLIAAMIFRTRENKTFLIL